MDEKERFGYFLGIDISREIGHPKIYSHPRKFTGLIGLVPRDGSKAILPITL